jgi:hypothetical protein
VRRSIPVIAELLRFKIIVPAFALDLYPIPDLCFRLKLSRIWTAIYISENIYFNARNYLLLKAMQPDKN